MPELPDLEYVAAQLQREAVGRTVDAVRVKEPVVLRIAVAGTLGELVVGKRLAALQRRGNFLVLDLEPGLQLVVNPMLAGRFQLVPSSVRSPAALCFALSLGDAGELRYVDDKKMGKVYLVPHGDFRQVPLIAELGAEVLAPDFTLERFAALVKKRRDQVRPFLMDKRALSAIGNAYADEILFAARIHPKTRCSKLTPHDIEQLHAAIGSVLRAAIAEVARRGAPIDEKVRDFLQVRGRAGELCLRCGTKIRTARVVDADACFCPICQPATRTLFIDWSKASKPG